MENSRNSGIDKIKTIAVFFIVGIHISTLWMNSFFSFDWIVSIIYNGIFRAGVPLFFMASGFLLLNPEKELDIKKLYGKNLLRLIIALFFWATVYKMLEKFISGDFSLGSFKVAILDIILFRHEQHLYFLHIMIIVYVFMPITRIFIKNADKKMLKYFIAVWFVLGIFLPTLKNAFPNIYPAGIASQWIINMTYSAIG